ncbi:hypothetical protein ANCCAN_04475 [Ancylostoma caninum]|uniref:Uncharacterized protein n=1 Tax=Ancylostoma caninum TaxID=29170 RepID=A0A368H2A2_ANCCA|nr:hypothetical protein ANCCAN_04475 [Ancylostoma caninum]
MLQNINGSELNMSTKHTLPFCFPHQRLLRVWLSKSHWMRFNASKRSVSTFPEFVPIMCLKQLMSLTKAVLKVWK